jgi:hypothetical protein
MRVIARYSWGRLPAGVACRSLSSTSRRSLPQIVAEAINMMEPSKVTGLVLNDDDHPVSTYQPSTAGPRE